MRAWREFYQRALHKLQERERARAEAERELRAAMKKYGITDKDCKPGTLAWRIARRLHGKGDAGKES